MAKIGPVNLEIIGVTKIAKINEKQQQIIQPAILLLRSSRAG